MVLSQDKEGMDNFRCPSLPACYVSLKSTEIRSVFILFLAYRQARQSDARDHQQNRPQHGVAGIAGLRDSRGSGGAGGRLSSGRRGLRLVEALDIAVTGQLLHRLDITAMIALVTLSGSSP